MESYLKENGWILAVLIFMTKELFSLFKNSTKEYLKALQDNTHAVIKLTVKMEYVEKKLEEIPAIKDDLNGIGGKLRELSAKQTS